MNVAHIVVHVEAEEVTQSLDVLKRVNAILNVLIMTTAKDWIVDEDAVYSIVRIGSYDCFFKGLSVQLSKFKGDPRLSTTAFGHLGVLFGAGVGVGEEGDQLYLKIIFLYMLL